MYKNASAHISNDEKNGKEQGTIQSFIMFSSRSNHISKLTSIIIGLNAFQVETN